MREAAHLQLLLDYDGTLAPIAATPDQAAPLPGTASLLERLTDRPRTSLAIVTGRTIADVRRLLDLSQATYVGLHGAEIQHPGGPVEVDPAVTTLQRDLPRLKAQLEEALAGRHGVWIEDKGAALACHYRQASRVDAAEAQRIVAEIAATYRDRHGPIGLLHGHEISELRAAGIDKGRAVLTLLAAAPAAALPVYAGDDATDEDAFQRLPAAAITIRVAAAEVATHARYLARGPREIREWLEAFEQTT